MQGYQLHIGNTPGTYHRTIDVGLPAIINGRVHSSVHISGGSKYFACTAYATDGLESDYSDELTLIWMPIPIFNVMLND